MVLSRICRHARSGFVELQESDQAGSVPLQRTEARMSCPDKCARLSTVQNAQKQRCSYSAEGIRQGSLEKSSPTERNPRILLAWLKGTTGRTWSVDVLFCSMLNK